MSSLACRLIEKRGSSISDNFVDKIHSMQPGDPLDLLKGISDMFVSYEPDFGFDNTLEFSENPKSE